MVGNKHIRIIPLYICAISLALILSSCRKKCDETATKSADDEKFSTTTCLAEQTKRTHLVDKISEVGSVEKSVQLWNQGKQDKALKEFLNITLTENYFSDSSVLSLTEKDFISLSPSEQTNKQKEIDTVLRAVKMICRYALEKGRASFTSKDYNIAENLFNGVLQCGLALSQPESLAIVKMTGRALQKAALKELVQLYAATGNQVKLEATKKSRSQF